MRNEMAGTIVFLIWLVFNCGIPWTLMQCIREHPQETRRLANYGALGMAMIGFLSLVLGMMVQAYWEVFPLHEEQAHVVVHE